MSYGQASALLGVVFKPLSPGLFPKFRFMDDAVEVDGEGTLGRIRWAQIGQINGSISQTFWINSRHFLRGIFRMALGGKYNFLATTESRDHNGGSILCAGNYIFYFGSSGLAS